MGAVLLLTLFLCFVPLPLNALLERKENSRNDINKRNILNETFIQMMRLSNNASSSHPRQRRRIQQKQQERSRPKMYTYFERIPMERRFTDMSDEDDDVLLDFWKKSWSAAGWEPVVLGLKDAQSHKRFEEYEESIQALLLEDFYAISFRRYIAMAAITQGDGGGWICDYDAFPIRDFRSEPLPHRGEFTVHSAVPATLASASSVHWETTLQALLADAKLHMPPLASVNDQEGDVEITNKKRIVFKRNLWSDTSGMYNLLRNSTVHSYRFVMGGSMLLMEPPPWNEDTFCRKRQFRKKYRVVHMDATSLAGTAALLSRLPKHRAAVAREVVPLFEKYCGVKVREDDENAKDVPD